MQVRRNTDFTGWPSTEGQTGSQHALEGKTMTKQEKIQYVAKLTMVTEEVAKAYLEAEEWLVDEAVYTIEAERKAGLL